MSAKEKKKGELTDESKKIIHNYFGTEENTGTKRTSKKRSKQSMTPETKQKSKEKNDDDDDEEDDDEENEEDEIDNDNMDSDIMDDDNLAEDMDDPYDTMDLAGDEGNFPPQHDAYPDTENVSINHLQDLFGGFLGANSDEEYQIYDNIVMEMVQTKMCYKIFGKC